MVKLESEGLIDSLILVIQRGLTTPSKSLK